CTFFPYTTLFLGLHHFLLHFLHLSHHIIHISFHGNTSFSKIKCFGGNSLRNISLNLHEFPLNPRQKVFSLLRQSVRWLFPSSPYPVPGYRKFVIPANFRLESV